MMQPLIGLSAGDTDRAWRGIKGVAIDAQVLYTYRDALRWCQQIAAGVAHLHDRSPLIIHRDLKLDNVLLCGAPLQCNLIQSTCSGYVLLAELGCRGMR